MQHQYLKAYGAVEEQHQLQEPPPVLDYPSSDHADQRNITSSPSSFNNTTSIPSSFNAPRPVAPQSRSSSSTSLPSSYQQYHSISASAPSSSSVPLPQPPHPPPPPKQSSHLPPIQPAPPIHSVTPIQPAPASPVQHATYSTPTDDNSRLMRQLIEQCSSIYQRIGKYRTDPLRESERNQIIDQVFFTAEEMLDSLNSLRDRLENNDLNESSLSIDPPAMNSTNTGISDHSDARQMDYTYDEDSAPPSGNESTLEEYKLIRQARNLQKNARPKYRRRSRTSMVGHRCHSCNTTDTPEWRRGPDGARTLCNACGLHYSKLLRKGSLTVQTHNYMIEAPPDGPRPQPRAIQFPIIQVNSSNNPDNNTSMRSLPAPSLITKSSFSKYSTSARIEEVDEEEEERFVAGMNIR
ncbi:GATA-type zinc finger transcription factor [Mucor lusitanicus CBS 277.49]|uniref:GATA-type zinc finger transcription factor n=2 Tax=Mucor circinelloides f. lusitanicus TaxID=29924 RepID=A0A168K9Q1_MUCCL|nr:GATA-type zinc finger transcription factor [Mucor lusitanicus CBS 277.49]